MWTGLTGLGWRSRQPVAVAAAVEVMVLVFAVSVQSWSNKRQDLRRYRTTKTLHDAAGVVVYGVVFDRRLPDFIRV